MENMPHLTETERSSAVPTSLTQRTENSGRDPNALPIDMDNLTHPENIMWNYVHPEKYQLENPAWLWEEHSCKNPTGKPWA